MVQWTTDRPEFQQFQTSRHFWIFQFSPSRPSTFHRISVSRPSFFITSVSTNTDYSLKLAFFGDKCCNVLIRNFRMDHPGRWLMIRVRGTEKLTLKNSILGENNILGTIVMSFLYWVLFSLIRKLFRNISEEHS